MRKIPVIFPIGLILILLTIFFTGAYAVSEAAMNSQDVLTNEVSGRFSKEGRLFGQNQTDTSSSLWYQNAAIFICPLH